MKSLAMLGLCGCVLLVDGPAVSDDAAPSNCANAVTQQDLNQCSQRDYEAADAALNAQWKQTKATVAAWDADLDLSLRGAEKALLSAQRAWIAYRDAHCETEGFQARGGSMEPMLVMGCLATLTQLRTEELKALAEGIGN